MEATDSPNRSGSRSKLSLVAAIVLLVALLGAAGWFVIGGSQAFAARTVADLLSTKQDIRPVEATQELCADPACVEAWETDSGSYLRFESDGEAEYWATVLGDAGRRNHKIVLDMRNAELTFAQQRYAIDVLFSDRDWN